MKNKMLYFFTVAICAISSAGDHTGTGGGIAEKNLVFGYLNLPKYLDLCLQSDACHIDSAEKNILKAIQGSLPLEGPADQIIIFLSGKTKPGFFVIDGQPKIAKTTPQVGSPIYVDIDLLYSSSPSGVVPLSVAGSVALLVHELGHHHGISDHTRLDLLGAKVESLLLRHTQEIDFGPYQRQIRAIAITTDTKPSFTQLLVTDGTQLLDLTKNVADALRCPLGDVAGAWLSNVHWGIEQEFDIFHVPSVAVADIWAWLNLFCRNGGGISEVVRQSVDVSVYMNVSPIGSALPPTLSLIIPPSVQQVECDRLPCG